VYETKFFDELCEILFQKLQPKNKKTGENQKKHEEIEKEDEYVSLSELRELAIQKVRASTTLPKKYIISQKLLNPILWCFTDIVSARISYNGKSDGTGIYCFSEEDKNRVKKEWENKYKDVFMKRLQLLMENGYSSEFWYLRELIEC